MEFLYTVDPWAEVPIMLLNDDIGVDPETGKGIDGSKFQAELMALDAMKPKSIEVWINSTGGNVEDGYNINSAILLSKTPVDTVDVGMAASIAGVFFQAGRKRIMMDYAWLMYHNPSGGDNKKLLDTMKVSIAKMVARSGKTEEDILAMMKKETFIDAAEALKLGLCDEIRNGSDHNKKRLTFSGLVADVNNFHQNAKLVVNKILETKPKNKIMSLKLVTNKLGLNEDATEDNILKAIEKVENKLTQAESELVKVQNKAKSDMDDAEDKVAKAKAALKKAEDDLAGMKKEKDALAAETDSLKKEKADAEDAMNTEKCKNMVQGFAKAGRIKDEPKTITFWTELAKADFATVKDQIEALPLNKTAPVITITPDANSKKYTFGVAMVEIKNKLEKQSQNN